MREKDLKDMITGIVLLLVIFSIAAVIGGIVYLIVPDEELSGKIMLGVFMLPLVFLLVCLLLSKIQEDKDKKNKQRQWLK